MSVTNLLIYIIINNVMVMVTTQMCPMAKCSCQQYPPDIKVINCRDKGLTEIPKIEYPTRQHAYKVTFSTNQNTESIYCSNCNRIQTVMDNAFNGIIVTSLDLSKNPLRIVSNISFKGLENNLTELFLSGDKNSKPPYSALDNLTVLETLELYDFVQLHINTDNNFHRFPKLRKFVLHNMKISYIERYSFLNKLTYLRILELRNNEDLRTIPVGALNHLPSLKNLVLTKNGITTVPYAAFKNLFHLVELDLSNNLISRLQSGCFKSIRQSLQVLKLQLNQLDEYKLFPLTEGYWSQLKVLNLAYNKFRKIPENLFINMIYLKHLYFNSNKITSILKNNFRALSEMKEIDLSSNNLLYIQGDSFSDLQKLSYLDLRGQNEWNRYLKLNITRESVNGLENELQELLLTQTKVEESTIWDAIGALRRLRVLQLGRTGLTFIKDYAFKNHFKLQYLELSENGIFEITDKGFYGLKNSLLTLDLSQNSIHMIDKCVFKDFSLLSQIYLWRNPLHCDCRLKWLHDWIEEKKQDDPFVIYTADPICNTPEDVHNYPIYELNRDDLRCHQNYTEPSCIIHSTAPPTTSTSTTARPTTTPTIGDKPTGTIMVPKLDMNIDKKGTTSLKLVWKVTTTEGVQKFLLSVLKDDVNNAVQLNYELAKTTDYFLLNRLDPNSFYEICVHIIMTHDYLKSPGTQKCVFSNTLPISIGPINKHNSFLFITSLCFTALMRIV